MKCPYCGEESPTINANLASSAEGDPKLLPIIRVIAYTCAKCQSVIGIESHPLERDRRLASIEENLQKLTKLLVEQNRRNSFKAGRPPEQVL